MNFYAQTYTCEDGAIAKILIPDTATEDDLKGIKELFEVIMKRKFKINLERKNDNGRKTQSTCEGINQIQCQECKADQDQPEQED